MSEYPTHKAVARCLYPEVRELHVSPEFYCTSSKCRISYQKEVTRITMEREAKTLTRTRREGKIVSESSCVGKYTLSVVFNDECILVQFPVEPDAYEIYEFYYYDPTFDKQFLTLIRRYLKTRRLGLKERITYTVDVPQ